MLRPLFRQYYKTLKGILFFVGGSDPSEKRLAIYANEIALLMQEKKLGIPSFANKNDRPGFMSTGAIIEGRSQTEQSCKW